MSQKHPLVLKRICQFLAAASLFLCAGVALQAQTLNASGAAAPANSADAGMTANAPAALMGTNALSNTTPLLQSSQQAAKPGFDAVTTEPSIQNLPRKPVKPAAPNQFQRFVQESTGRLLPIFGRDLFDNPQTYTPNAAVPAPDNYILGPGDEVRLQVSGPQDFASVLVIDRNGQVSLPKVGPVTLAGVAAQDLDKTLTSHLGKVFTNFKASAVLGRLRGIQVYVVGQAQQPGTFQLSSVSTLVNALFASGGPGPNGSMRAIELKRAGKTVSTLDLYDFFAKGDKSRDVALLSGDVIVIPPAGARVAVTGAFDQSAIYELKPGTNTISSILSLGGGVPTLAQTKKALLERIDPSSTPPRRVSELALDTQGLQTTLQDGDVLTLLNISPAFANAVTLQGVVADPVRASWYEGMKVSDLIPNREALITPDYYKRKNSLVQKIDPRKEMAQTDDLSQTEWRDGQSVNERSWMDTSSNAKLQKPNPYPSNNSNPNPQFNNDKSKDAGKQIDSRIRTMVDQINWDYAVIERLDRNKLSQQLISFNLGKAVQKDPEHNLTLLPGDVVTVVSQHDLQLPQEKRARLVRLEGEVAAPGVYQVQAGETLPQLIQRIGGLTPQAYVFGTELNRESIKAQQQDNLDKLIRRLEGQTQSQSNSFLSNRAATAEQGAAALQMQQTQLKNQIERLKSVKSSGRLALELDPSNPKLSALPDLPLEDGDRIMVPSTPGFVGAFGSVNNENMFIYRKGKTVSDVIRSAGLTDDAEPDQAFVLRADGSVISRSDVSSLFSKGFESLALMPGDTLVVPAKIDRESTYNTLIRGAKDWTQILSNLGIGVAAWKSMGY